MFALRHNQHNNKVSGQSVDESNIIAAEKNQLGWKNYKGKAIEKLEHEVNGRDTGGVINRMSSCTTSKHRSNPKK